MKPLKLTMSAFGPYSDETEIDFRALGRSGVYLVCGDTGSGKTMIFDAICFALFGEASGDSRNGARSSASLRSDFADPASKTFVELEFSYRGQTYRVKRNPDYERAKMRGEGTTKEPANAEIELPDGRCIGGVRKVNMQVEELLGIDANQFKQIVMLAQGEFRKLLTADTATREGIFRKLFATQKYEMLQDRLGEECRKLERENEKLKSEVLRCAQTVRFAPQDARKEELDERRGSGAPMGAWLVELLEGLVTGDKAESEQLSRQVEELRRKWADANALVKQVENRPRYERERAALAGEVVQHEGRTEGLQAALQQECAHDAKRLEATERAVVIEGTFAKYQALQCADQAVSAAKEALLRSEQACKTAQAAAGKAEEQRVQAAQAVEKLAGSDVRQAQAKAASDAAQVRVSAAGEALAGAKDLAAKTEAAQKAQKQVQALLEQEASLVAAERKAQDAVAQAKEVSESFAGADVALSEAGAALDRASRAEQDASQAVRRRGELQQAAQAAVEPYRRAVEQLKAAEAVHDKDLAQVQQLQKAQRAGRAGLLAADLQDGSPCPVCGSVHHPSPARAAGSIPSDDEIDKAIAVEAASKQAADQAAREAEGAKTRCETAQFALGGFYKEHGGEQNVVQALAQARDGVAAAKRAKADAQLRCDQAARAAKSVAEAESAHERSVTALSQVKDARQAAERDYASADAEARALRERLAVVSVDEAQRAFENAQHDASVAQTELNNAERAVSAFAAAQRGRQAAEEAAKQAAEQARKAEEALQNQTQAQQLAEQEAKHLRSDLDFSSLDAAQTEAARLRQQADALKRRRDAAQQAVEQNAQQLATKRQLLAAKNEQLAELPAGDAAAAAKERNDYEEQGKLASERLGAVNLRVSANGECLEQLRKTLKRTGDIEERYGRIKLMADAANGNLTGRAKVRFEAYVQGMYFDKVIAAANQRLRVLTAGQFELVRWSESVGNSKAGLGLYVIDSFTGRARDASSLSGGESFQASLCLALGLSDIVQAHAGGIEFDTMFVDEGFGSLDQGALGNAISLLSDLSGGNKLVGIISHVEDLKANIPKRITVTKTQSGSTAKVEA